ncbi:MAG TPA: hypothetical protein VGL04_00560 [Sporichthyaceae bacterium]|jgi:hypothetical protein
MASRRVPRWFIAALFAVSAVVPVVGAGAATAATAHGPGGGHDGYGDGYGYGGYGHHYRHHYHENCNNDPESGFAQSDYCPHNWDYPGNPDD